MQKVVKDDRVLYNTLKNKQLRRQQSEWGRRKYHEKTTEYPKSIEGNKNICYNTWKKLHNNTLFYTKGTIIYMKKNKKKWLVAVIVLLLGFCFRQYLSDAYHNISQKLKEENTDKIDWDLLQKKNPDIYAWLHVPGTPIDYPIVQSQTEEEGFYLTHDVDKEKNIYGAIYTEKINNKDFTDPMTVVYGHNMRDGSMFGSLKKFADPGFFREQDKIIIYLPGNEVLTYQIAAAYEYPADHLISTFDLQTEEKTDAYFQKVRGFAKQYGGNYREKVQLKAPAVTLSTCTAGDSSFRYLVQGVLIDRKKEG